MEDNQGPPPESLAPTSSSPSPLGSSSRPAVEFLAVILMGMLLFRTFAAEAYIVPTGSMAPTLLGQHQELTCPDCRLRFAVGMDDRGRAARPTCPNCGRSDFDRAETVDRSGDRLLVQKYVFDWFSPRRWEVAVFQNPNDPSQAYVKRVVGLPGESIRIAGGDIYVNGRIARKSLAEQRAMRILVHDNNFSPTDAEHHPRWLGRYGGGWRPRGTGFVWDVAGRGNDGIDWLEYRHWDPDRGGFGAIRDFTPYNGGEGRGENRVEDLMVEAKVAVRPGVRAVSVRFRGGADRFVVTIPVDGQGVPSVSRNGWGLPVSNARGGLASSPAGASRPSRLEASWVDHRLTVALDGTLLFDPIDIDDPTSAVGPDASPVALGAQGEGSVEVSELRLGRDVYYTGDLAGSPRRPFGVEVPYRLGPGEFFVLGDNSPVSNDSRFWPGSPVVRAEFFIGKPFLVHLPSWGLPLRVFGGETYWVPDPREIRYIR